jgi:hypothetical protein
MGYRTILNASKTLRLKNLSGSSVSVSGATLAPGQTREVAASLYMQDRYRSNEISTLVRRAGAAEGLAYAADDLVGIEAPLADAVPVQKNVADTTALTASDYPAGTTFFDVAAGTLKTSDGSIWV